MSPADQTGQPASPRQVVLGLFILGQLAFLLLGIGVDWLRYLHPHQSEEAKAVANEIIPGWGEKKGHAWEISGKLARTTRDWAELTGQYQDWSLFAPDVWNLCGFPGVLFSWDEEPSSAPALARPLTLLNARDGVQAAALLPLLDLRTETAPANRLPKSKDLFRSDNEQVNPDRYFRIGQYRTRRYEISLILYLRTWSGEAPDEKTARWEKAIERYVRDYHKHIEAYLRWRLAVYQQQHPERPLPKQVILVERTYHIMPPYTGSPHWQGPYMTPLARWQPTVQWQGGYLPLEPYNPRTERFERVRR